MKSIIGTLALLTGAVLLFSACGAGSTGTVARSGQSRLNSPDVPGGDPAALVQGNNGFALDLYRSLRSQQGNLIFSPYSISLALAMTYAGAQGETEQQMAGAMHFDLPQDRLHPAFNRLDLELAERGEGSAGNHPLQLAIANAIWAQQDHPFLQTYLDRLALNYGAGIHLADFVNQSEAVRGEINAWVAGQTRDRIKDLLPEGIPDAQTRMVLVNAIYFKADWERPFDPNSTGGGPFHLLDGSQVQVRMMSETMLGVPYAQGDGYQAIELPYQGGTAAMDILVPDQGKFDEFEAGLDAEGLARILGEMQPAAVQLGLPKFTLTGQFGLADRLAALGMPDAFDPDAADFSGMDGQRDLYISAVIHKAFVAVDEKGTEAAAATGVIMETTGMPVVQVNLTVDRPFLFLIRDLPSGQILFVGRVVNPSQ